MTLQYQDIHSLSAADIQRLVADGVPEGRDIEYKEQLPKEGEEDKREFRFDVSSFANASGGIIIYGVKEKKVDGKGTGIPERLIPLIVNVDQEALRLEQILRTQIDPRIPGVQIRFIQVEDGHVAVIKILRSWLGLHLVKHNDSYRFYSRTSKGKYILDATEIRTGFISALDGYEQLRRFRYDRLAKIVANEGPVALEEGVKVVIHLLPLSSLDVTNECDLSPIQDGLQYPPSLAGGTGWTNQHNYQGFIKSVRLAQDFTRNYIQFFRNGSIEEVLGEVPDSKMKVLPSFWIERDCIRSLTNMMAAFKRIGGVPPFLVFLSVLGIRGYIWQVEARERGVETIRAFREPDLLLPEVLVQSGDLMAHTILRPLFDRIWNAAGHLRSVYYDQVGNWIGRK